MELWEGIAGPHAEGDPTAHERVGKRKKNSGEKKIQEAEMEKWRHKQEGLEINRK